MTQELERADMRASDVDRAAVAQRLQHAVDEGRLGLTDYDERLRDAYAARTYAELDRVTADLPAAAAAPAVSLTKDASGGEVAEKRREWVEEWRSWGGAAIIMIGIWGTLSLVSGSFSTFWPAIPLGIWAAIILASAVSGKSRGHGG